MQSSASIVTVGFIKFIYLEYLLIPLKMKLTNKINGLGRFCELYQDVIEPLQESIAGDTGEFRVYSG